MTAMQTGRRSMGALGLALFLLSGSCAMAEPACDAASEAVKAARKVAKVEERLAERLSGESFAEIDAKVRQIAREQELQPREIVLALDIDNTVLAMDRDLGSEPWFDWQAKKVSKEALAAPDPTRAAASFNELLELNTHLLNSTGMHPAEPAIPALVKKLQKDGYSVIVLTSRGPDVAKGTEEGFKKAFGDDSFSFKASAVPVAAGKALPKGERPSLYQNGIYYTSGGDKGKFLKQLLEVSDRGYRAVVYVDNKEKYCEQIHKAFADTVSPRTTTFNYTRMNRDGEQFLKDAERQARAVAEFAAIQAKLKGGKRPQLPASRAGTELRPEAAVAR